MHMIMPDNAHKILNWFHTRGGIVLWDCIDLSNCGPERWTAPKMGLDGTESGKPHWSAGNPHAGKLEDCAVIVPMEVRRFRVALRMGAQGFKIKCTDASSRKIEKALDKINDGRTDCAAWYEFDYDTQEAVFYVPDGSPVLLEMWCAEHPLVNVIA